MTQNLANTPEPNPVNSDESQPALWDKVISDFEYHYMGDKKVKSDIVQMMKDRKIFGFYKYGCYLKIHNGRNFIHDGLQELLDASVYLCGAVDEHESKGLLYETYKDTLKLLSRLYEIKTILDGIDG